MTTPGRTSPVISILAMLVFNVFRRLAGLISIAFLARFLTPAEVGAYAFTQTVSQTFQNMFRFGVPQGVHVSVARRLSSSETKEIGEILGCGLVLLGAFCAAGCTVLVLFAVPIAKGVFGQPDLAPFMIPAAVLFAGLLFSQWAYLGFAGLERFVAYTFYATIIGIVTVIATITAALIFGLHGAVWAFSGATLAGVPLFVVGLLRCTRGFGIAIHPNLRYDRIRQIFTIGFPAYGAVVFMTPAIFIAQGAVSRFGGVEDLADLRVILTLMSVVQILPHAISGPIISLFSAREGQAAGSGSISAIQHMRWLWILALVMGTFLAAVWPLAVFLVFGSGFPQAAQMGQLAIVALMPTIIGTALSAGIMVGGRTLPLMNVGAIQGAVMVGVALTLVPAIGLPGFFAAEAAASTSAAVLWLIVLGRQNRTAVWRSWMGPLLVASLALSAMLIADAWIDETALQRGMAAGVIFPAMCLWIAFTALSRQERKTLIARARREVGQIRSRLGTGKGARKT